MSLKHLFVFGCTVLLVACDKEPGEIPAYIDLGEVQLTTEPGEGAPSHKITDLWIELGNEFHGAYPIGQPIPVLESGPTRLLIFPGVKMNGVTAFPDIYPMYAPIRDTLDFTLGERIELPLTFRYKENVFFALQEDFEAPHNLNVDLDEFDSTFISRTSTDVKWGQRAGLIELSHGFPRLKVGSDRIFTDLWQPNRRVYLELDYKSEEPIFIGFRGNKAGLAPQNLLDAVINPKDEWNKIYFDFTNFVRGTQWDNYQLLIEAGWTPRADTTETSRIWLDNIKLMYLNP
jgi:hypothetical protein